MMEKSPLHLGKVFVVTHLNPGMKLPSGYEYIGVGNQNTKLSLTDRPGDSISEVNPYFSELTAMYWIWKNYKCSPEEIVGLVHYRRFLVSGILSMLTKEPIPFPDIETALSRSEIITPEPVRLMPSIYDNYLSGHNVDDLDMALSIAERNDCVPSGYYSELLKSRNRGSICNVLMCRKRLFDEYCEWLFGILIPAFELIKTEGRTGYQKRVFGFISERLFNVWLIKNTIKQSHFPMIRTDFSFLKNYNHRRLNMRKR